jgi:hypothetical protein
MLVLSGTLAVTHVPWAAPDAAQVLTASSGEAPAAVARDLAPQDVLRDRLLAELQEQDPGVALTHLQQATNRRPSLAEHCESIARSLGRAAVAKYGSVRAHAFSRPVCDTSFASGVQQAG